MKRVIINADDFGLTSGINKGIILAHQKGILTSTTLMANMPGFSQAVKLAKKNKSLGVGIHLNIIRGEPISSPQKVPSLLNNHGHFLTTSQFLKKIVLRKIILIEIEYEFRAQIEKVLGKGIHITHFDSEKHIHSIPQIMQIVTKLAIEYRIPRIRFINEFCLSSNITQSFKSILVSFLNSRKKKDLINSGILIPDKFYGICKSGQMNKKRFKIIFSKLNEGITEIMTHPGIVDKELNEIEQKYGPFYLRKGREKELETLLDQELKKIIKKENIQLIHFGHIRGNQ
ncbi:MAG: carbohydrate deacetylase [Candidatus Aminicenantia bacterium]